MLPINLKGKQRLLGVDYGEKRIGLAISDLTWTIASPYAVVVKEKFLLALQEINKTYGEIMVVIGWPLHIDGTKSISCDKVDYFITKYLHNYTVHKCDERLSTAAVTRTMITANLSRQKQKQVVDKLAAAYMLQGYLDQL